MLQAKVVRLIETTHSVGTGEIGNRSRMVSLYWTLEGEFLFQYDPMKKNKEENPLAYLIDDIGVNTLPYSNGAP